MGHSSRLEINYCQAPRCRPSHSSTACQENLTYFPRRTTGSGSWSRCRARSRVFSRIQLCGTARRAASSAGVRSAPGFCDAAGDCSTTASGTLSAVFVFGLMLAFFQNQMFFEPLKLKMSSPHLQRLTGTPKAGFLKASLFLSLVIAQVENFAGSVKNPNVKLVPFVPGWRNREIVFRHTFM